MPNYVDALLTEFGCGLRRSARVNAVLPDKAVRLNDVFRALRDHGVRSPSSLGYLGCDVCAHAGALPTRVSQTTASLVVHIKDGLITLWATGTSAPCISLFKPFYLECPSSLFGKRPGPCWDAGDSLWWVHEVAHRRHVTRLSEAIAVLQPYQSALEESFMEFVESVGPGTTAPDRIRIAKLCWQEQAQFTELLMKGAWTASRDWSPSRRRSSSSSSGILRAGEGYRQESCAEDTSLSVVRAAPSKASCAQRLAPSSLYITPPSTPLYVKALVFFFGFAPFSELVFRLSWLLANRSVGIPAHVMCWGPWWPHLLGALGFLGVALCLIILLLY